jgi:hypothetical protein
VYSESKWRGLIDGLTDSDRLWFWRRDALWFSHLCPKKVANADQLWLEASPTRRAMTMAGNRTPKVDKKVASILADVLTAKMSPKPTVVSEARLK